jgi:hypothetical protein
MRAYDDKELVDNNLLNQSRIQWILRQEDRLVRITFAALHRWCIGIRDQVVAIRYVIEADNEDLDRIILDAQAQEVVVATEAQSTERIVTIHPQPAASNQEIETEKGAPNEETDDAH